MLIKFIEIQNFRKLKSIRIDFADEKTVFVGANNSGKTSAMDALGHFLVDKERFVTDDFTLSNWSKINQIGTKWETIEYSQENINISEWEDILPSIDVWLEVSQNEIHHVSHLLPTLDWEGGKLGVRLRLEPENIENFYKEYIASRKSAKDTIEAAKKKPGVDFQVELWPSNMREYLDKRLKNNFTIKSYILNPEQCVDPQNGVAKPQSLVPDIEPLENDPFKGLIRIHKIDAQRGFSDSNTKGRFNNDNEERSDYKGKLSEQLRSYYKKHIDPSEMPEPSDVEALDAIYKAQKQFDEKLKDGFKSRFAELQDLGYPGITDPKLNISTKIKPMDGINHPSAIQYEVAEYEGQVGKPVYLPEQYNGLGYQNLISIVFKLMSFRDDWLQEGKLSKKSEENLISPLHLVLVEEPEAHLHAQVQQVFIREAYNILRKNEKLTNNKNLATQLVVSTHSSHIAHECEFSCLRYFKRRPATKKGDVPISTVANLSKVFGSEPETERFVIRYLKTTHCDLFFADAVIMVEGSSERILLPYFIKRDFKELNQSYITLLEIGGSHSHRLRSLIEHIELTTLIVTDLDSVDLTGQSAITKTGASQKTSNPTLKTWVPKEESIDKLLGLKNDKKILEINKFLVRAAYQVKIPIKFKDTELEAPCDTFELALILENLGVFKDLKENGLIKKFKNAIEKSGNSQELIDSLFKIINDSSTKKAEFALDILYLAELENIQVPNYIKEGLSWLQAQMAAKQKDLLIPKPLKASEKKGGIMEDLFKVSYNDDSHVDDQISKCLNLDNLSSFFLFAGAGSGKTSSLVKCLKKLKEESGKALRLRGQRIAVITYTNAACDNIKQRIDFDPLIEVSTIHSFVWTMIKGFNYDIRNWLKVKLEKDIHELIEEERKGRAGTKASIDRQKKIESKNNRLSKLDSVKIFTYNPNSENRGQDSLNHSEVVEICADFLSFKPLMQDLLISKFPILLIDESQDTNKLLVESFFKVQASKSGKFALGLIGDTMQRIYSDGKHDLGINLPADWAQPTKKMNYRCPKRIIKLINKIRSEVDRQEQKARDGKEDGFVRLFIVPNNISEKQKLESVITGKMAVITQDSLWNDNKEVKTLILEHHMAASRMGFLSLFEVFSKVDDLRTSLLDGTLPVLRLFSQIILPLIKAKNGGKDFIVMSILRQHSPLLDKISIRNSGDDQRLQIAKTKDAVNELFKLWKDNNDPSFLDILKVIHKTGLFEIPEAIRFAVLRDSEEYKLAEEEVIEDIKTKEKLEVWNNFLELPFNQIEPYNLYVTGQANFDTHQGVKGLEFPRVAVIIDDSEARGFLFKYDKLFGVDPKTKNDIEKERAGEDTGVNRVRRLFYVTCSRAEESLAIIAYSKNPEAVKKHVIEQDWFNDNEIEIITSI